DIASATVELFLLASLVTSLLSRRADNDKPSTNDHHAVHRGTVRSASALAPVLSADRLLGYLSLLMPTGIILRQRQIRPYHLEPQRVIKVPESTGSMRCLARQRGETQILLHCTPT